VVGAVTGAGLEVGAAAVVTLVWAGHLVGLVVAEVEGVVGVPAAAGAAAEAGVRHVCCYYS
jgi:hypothetical protein